MSDNTLNDAIKSIEAARNAQRVVTEREQQKLAQLEQALAQLQHTILVVDPEHMPKRTDWAPLGILAAAKMWLTEVGEARSTVDIAQALLARGVKTKSKRYVPTVYATLRNSDEFLREGDKWQLRRGKA